mmetsp:Transcript_46781/g.130238  ORF Transcript_46781/g.130238 Transcript_46781/m.130238 type:complete len:299 (-) Transcript_46781:102-998(-)
MPIRPRWADLKDSSNEETLTEPPLAPSLATDSYRDPPEAGLNDNSSAGLNLQMRCAANLKEAPTDFAFLLGHGRVGGPKAVLAEEESAEAGDASSACRVYGAFACPSILTADSQDSSLDGWRARHATSVNQVPTDFAFLFTNAGEALREEGSISSHARPQAAEPAGGQKRTGQQVHHAPTGKRPRGGDCLIGGVVVAAGGQSPPDADEEAWRRRTDKRRLSVMACKATPEYCAYSRARARAERQAGEPQTPDPLDRSVSKRQWDEEVRLWRAALRKWCSSTCSTAPQQGADGGGTSHA